MPFIPSKHRRVSPWGTAVFMPCTIFHPAGPQFYFQCRTTCANFTQRPLRGFILADSLTAHDPPAFCVRRSRASIPELPITSRYFEAGFLQLHVQDGFASTGEPSSCQEPPARPALNEGGGITKRATGLTYPVATNTHVAHHLAIPNSL